MECIKEKRRIIRDDITEILSCSKGDREERENEEEKEGRGQRKGERNRR